MRYRNISIIFGFSIIKLVGFDVYITRKTIKTIVNFVTLTPSSDFIIGCSEI